jgi:hypothetical protein
VHVGAWRQAIAMHPRFSGRGVGILVGGARHGDVPKPRFATTDSVRLARSSSGAAFALLVFVGTSASAATC